MSQVYEDFLQYLAEFADTLEQVFSMTLRGMDIKRDKMLKEMGLEGVPLSKLAENYPPELFDRARKAAEHAAKRFEVFSCASEAARVTMECMLHDIERMMPESQPVPQRDKGEPPTRMKTDFRA